MTNGKMLLLLKSLDVTILLFEEMYAEVSFQCHLVEEGEVELPRAVQTAESKELAKTLLCQLEVRKQT